MDQICSLHNKKILEVCLYPECSNSSLCHFCIREHPKSHDSKIQDLSSLAENEDWLQSLEDKRDKFISEGGELLKQRGILIELKEYLKSAFQDIKEELTNKEKEILQELDNMIGNDNQEDDEKSSQNTFSEMENFLDYIEGLDFRGEDYFERVSTGLNFQEGNFKILLDEAREVLSQSVFDEEKILLFKDEMTQVIRSINFVDFLLKEPLQSFICKPKLLSELEALNGQTLKTNHHKLFESVEISNDWEACGPKLRFSEDIEVYYCKGQNNGCEDSKKLWGSGPYTCDSDKCTAIRHCGLDNFEGGYFLVEYAEGRDSYKGTVKNGIESKSWKTFPMSFSILKEIELQSSPSLHDLGC